MQKLDLGVRELDEDDRDAVVGFLLRGADAGAQRAAILRGGGLEVGHGDGDVVQASDHGRALLGSVARVMRRAGRLPQGAARRTARRGVVNPAFTLLPGE